MLRNCVFLTSTTEPRVVGIPLSCESNIGGCGGDSAVEMLCDNLLNEGTSWGVSCTEACSRGFFGDRSDIGCSACPSGKFGKSTAGRGQNEAGELCDGGTYNPDNGTVGAPSCTPCKPLTWSTYGAPKCFNVCVLGQY